MYLWNYKALIKDLKEDNVSEKDKFIYFMFTFLLLTVSTGTILSIAPEVEITTLDIIDYWVTTLVFVIAIILIYRNNKKGDNKNFLERYISLSVPIFIRVTVLGIFLSFLYIIFSPSATFTSTTITAGEHVMWGIANIIGYYVLYASIGEVSKKI